MKFFLSPDDQVRFRVRNDIPLSYIKHVKPFAKPTFLSAKPLDIIYQERTGQGFKLRNITLIANEACQLEWKIGRPRVTFQTIIGNSVSCTLAPGEVLHFDPMLLSIVQFNTLHHQFLLDPGVLQLIRLECSQDIISELAMIDSFARELADGYNPPTSRSYGTVPINPTFNRIIDEVLMCSFSNNLKEQVFSLRMKEALLSILEHKIQQVTIAL